MKFAQCDYLAKQLIQTIPDNKKYMLLIPGLARHEVLMYDLIVDPFCKLKLPRLLP